MVALLPNLSLKDTQIVTQLKIMFFFLIYVLNKHWGCLHHIEVVSNSELFNTDDDF